MDEEEDGRDVSMIGLGSSKKANANKSVTPRLLGWLCLLSHSLVSVHPCLPSPCSSTNDAQALDN